MEAPADQSTYWNQQTAKPFAHPLDGERFASRVAPGASILDFGCGQGRLCAELAALGHHDYTGIDWAPEMIRVASEHHPRGRFRVNEGSGVPADAASFDVVLLFAVLTCMPDDAAQKKLVSEFKRVLRPGGLILVSDYPLQTDERNRKRYEQFAHEAGGYGTFRLPEGALLRHHRREWLAELFADFSLLESRELEVLTMNLNPARIVQMWLRKT
jgi:2-polyprenyl-3-methyl-5-hydroxy-6-metoxy-1,4-benzoquinol methylase